MGSLSYLEAEIFMFKFWQAGPTTHALCNRIVKTEQSLPLTDVRETTPLCAMMMMMLGVSNLARKLRLVKGFLRGGAKRYVEFCLVRVL